MARAASRGAARDARATPRATTRRRATRAARDDAGAAPARPALNLLGRTVKVDHVLEGRADDALGRLAASVVADARGADADALARDVDRLFALCPGLGERVARGEVTRALAAELAVDLRETTAAMLAIRDAFVGADVDAGSVCAREPRLLRLREDGLEGVRARGGVDAGEVGQRARRRWVARDDSVVPARVGGRVGRDLGARDGSARNVAGRGRRQTAPRAAGAVSRGSSVLQGGHRRRRAAEGDAERL